MWLPFIGFNSWKCVRNKYNKKGLQNTKVIEKRSRIEKGGEILCFEEIISKIRKIEKLYRNALMRLIDHEVNRIQDFDVNYLHEYR